MDNKKPVDIMDIIQIVTKDQKALKQNEEKKINNKDFDIDNHHTVKPEDIKWL
jgi:hypothetical protein